MKPMLLLQLQCPHCQASLTRDQSLPLEAVIREDGRRGPITLSAVFGDHSVQTELDIADGQVIDLLCPQCENSLLLAASCKLCGAQVASLNLATGGNIELCSRRGCKAHALGGFGDVDAMMRLMNTMLDTPYD